MEHALVHVVRREHAAFASLLGSLSLSLRPPRDDERWPDFARLRALGLRLAEAVERGPRGAVQAVLLPMLVHRATLPRRLAAAASVDLARERQRLRELEQALAAFELHGEPARLDFALRATLFVELHLARMALVERELLPLAHARLSAAEWARAGIAASVGAAAALAGGALSSVPADEVRGGAARPHAVRVAVPRMTTAAERARWRTHPA